MNKKVNACSKCPLQNDCAVNDWSIYDSENPNCPNYEEGMKQYKQFLKEYLEEQKRNRNY